MPMQRVHAACDGCCRHCCDEVAHRRRTAAVDSTQALQRVVNGATAPGLLARSSAARPVLRDSLKDVYSSQYAPMSHLA